jgi:hypothetical protein
MDQVQCQKDQEQLELGWDKRATYNTGRRLGGVKVDFYWLLTHFALTLQELTILHLVYLRFVFRDEQVVVFKNG